MTSAVVDASVAVKWLVRQNLSEEAYLALERYELIAPSLILVEIGNALWKYHEAGQASREKLRAAMAGIEAMYFLSTPIDEKLTTAALEIAADIAHPLHDCYYLALSRAAGAPLITADKRLERAAAGAGFDVIDLAALPELKS
ncbi:type II toxin-antitoxin system VapC family toxin [Amphiplicatus metriothermophilus]|uniref:Ribonuclease VapC n=1 Tax=Amphiplicatus metriothermophilus TaxID=1519374 RepID=A0A239PK15_9PROT|nr:type II toxin-antitoxin system VapC family toxin [Amphiplicatus metriothermophilus]MBB5517513.1 putative nucleic acid-binding protein [Amphiplicatus metriothermophilus]SNT68152.1 Predicted nucleic acid-binding protein, contains PIN domain [Amphiplicatus metriothermophilus]